MSKASPLLLALASQLAISAASATDIQLLITDGAGQGFNDTSSVTPVGGNSGITLGEQRRIVFEYAADFWETVINSSVPIVIDASFSPLSCNSSSAVLGSAGPEEVDLNFPNRPIANTLYAQAQANALAGSDLRPSNADMSMEFNGAIDNNNNCLNNTNWYYGLDGAAPSGTIDLLSVVLHEIAHGLGFLTFVDIDTGEKLGGFDDAYMLLLEDHSRGQTWNQLNNNQRAASVTDTPDLHWVGTGVTAASGSLSSGINQGHVRMFAPGTVDPGSSVSHFDTSLTPNDLMEPTSTGPKTTVGLAKELLADMGWPVIANAPPIVNQVGSVAINESTSTSVDLVLMDDDTDTSALSVTASSSNNSLIDNAGLTFSGTSNTRSLQLAPLSGQSGTAQITVDVFDGISFDQMSFNLTVIANNTPVVSIQTPTDGANLSTLPITLSGTASDTEDGDLTASINWTSSLDGSLGNGGSIQSNLSDGNHQITASATDSGSKTGQAIINISVLLDTDGDGLSDANEALVGTNPNTADSDNDGINDFNEVNQDGDPSNYTPGIDTDPLNSDTDGDGILDGADTNPLVPKQIDEDIPFLPTWAMALLALIFLSRAAKFKS